MPITDAERWRESALYSVGGRASGRTYRMIMGLPEGALVVVPNQVMRNHLITEIAVHRGANFLAGVIVYPITDWSSTSSMMSMRRPIRVDHSFWESSRVLNAIKDRLREVLVAHRYSNPTPDEIQIMLAHEQSEAAHRTAFAASWEEQVETVFLQAARRPGRATRAQIYHGPEAEDL